MWQRFQHPKALNSRFARPYHALQTLASDCVLLPYGCNCQCTLVGLHGSLQSVSIRLDSIRVHVQQQLHGGVCKVSLSNNGSVRISIYTLWTCTHYQIFACAKSSDASLLVLVFVWHCTFGTLHVPIFWCLTWA